MKSSGAAANTRAVEASKAADLVELKDFAASASASERLTQAKQPVVVPGGRVKAKNECATRARKDDADAPHCAPAEQAQESASASAPAAGTAPAAMPVKLADSPSRPVTRATRAGKAGPLSAKAGATALQGGSGPGATKGAGSRALGGGRESKGQESKQPSGGNTVDAAAALTKSSESNRSMELHVASFYSQLLMAAEEGSVTAVRKSSSGVQSELRGEKGACVDPTTLATVGAIGDGGRELQEKEKSTRVAAAAARLKLANTSGRGTTPAPTQAASATAQLAVAAAAAEMSPPPATATAKAAPSAAANASSAAAGAASNTTAMRAQRGISAEARRR